jgi:3-hydroxyacyl-CoA dehydrogenase/enoyl-CoA hydratase/3-hydroxybutyryl-CoA epimerase
VQAALDRLIPDVTGEGLRIADVVIEAVPEVLGLKHQIYRDAEARMKPGALLATNTSSIPLEDLSKVLARPERLIGLHFFNPVAQMPLLEVVRGGSSGDAEIEAGLAFARRIDKLPLAVKSAPGFLVNRALTPYLMAAVELLDEGYSPAAIDEAAETFGMPMGPLELADAVGLDICLHVGEILAAGTKSGSAGWQAPKGLSRLIEQGHLGRKSGQGFYRYDKKGKPVKGKTPGNVGETASLQDRMLLPMLNTCVACWREALVEDADMVDAGMIFGTGFAPFRGGPMHYIKASDAKAMHAKLKIYAERHGSLYVPDPGWETLIAG